MALNPTIETIDQLLMKHDLESLFHLLLDRSEHQSHMATVVAGAAHPEMARADIRPILQVLVEEYGLRAR